MNYLFSIFIILITSSSLAHPLVEQGNAFYDQGDYEKAIASYTEARQEFPADGHIAYNLGNTYLRAGKQGESIAAFLSARHFLPRDPDIKANLNFALGKIQDSLTTTTPYKITNTLCFWLSLFTEKELFYLFAFFVVVSLSLLFLHLIFFKHPIIRKFIWGSTVLSIIGIGLWTTSRNLTYPWGAITTKEASIKSGPGEHNTDLFVLHEGAPFFVLDTQNDWYKIGLSDGKIGWVKKSEARSYLLN